MLLGMSQRSTGRIAKGYQTHLMIYQDNFIEKKESSQHQLKGALGTP